MTPPVTGPTSILRRMIAAALWLVLAAFAAKIVHDFYRHVDRAVYAAVDDGEAAIAYALATLGRYGFLPSPTLFGMSRLHGQFNYGPWYFYLAGAVVWLFGYSLTLVRSIHLWAIVACVAMGAAWFRERGRVAPAAWFGFATLYFFEAVEWPMARPDSLVAVFTVIMVISVGLAFRYRRARWWFAAGLAAVCGAFTHLVAVSVVASAGLLFGIFAIGRLRAEPGRDGVADVVRGGAALVAGALCGLVMFYGSFDFDFATQWEFLRGYRELTTSTSSYVDTLLQHFHLAFWITPRWIQASVWLTFVAGWAMLAFALARPRHRQAAAEYLLPPLLVWTLYFASNGKYTNYHAGYAILHHVMFAWTVAAMMWLTLEMIEARRPAMGAAVGLIAASLVLVQGVQQTQRQFAAPPREQQGVYWVPFTEYAGQVLHAIPARATAWGTVFFGIESPERIQLVQQADVGKLMLSVNAADRTDLAPDFLIRSYPEQRDDMIAVLRGGETAFSRVPELVPGSRFRLASLVSAVPYGVARVYARIDPAAATPPPAPAVSFYDGIHKQWLHRIGPPLPVAFAPAAPAVLQIGYETEPPRTPARATVAADLAPGPYLLKVALKPGAPSPRPRMIAVTHSTLTRQTMNELGPTGDFAQYLGGDHEVYALSDHPGGTLYVSQFDDGAGAAIETVTAYSVVELIDPAERPSHQIPLPLLSSWTAEAGVHVTLRDGLASVEGNAIPYGYQWKSPVVTVDAGDLVDVQVPSKVLQGEVCVGAVNAAGDWLVAADGWRAEFDFHADKTRGFSVVFANCQSLRETTNTRFEVQPGKYVDNRVELYADRLVGMALDPAHRPEPADPTIITFPVTLKATRTAVEQPIEALAPRDLSYLSPNAETGATSWTLRGQPARPYAYLLKSKERRFGTNAVALIQGRLSGGGLSFGLLRNEQWLTLVEVTTPGEFTAVVQPPSRGTYAIVIANNSKTADTSVIVDRVGVLPTGSGR